MEHFKIISPQETYQVEENSIFGELYIRVGETSFPYNNWGDLIASCLSMWSESVVALSGDKKEMKVKFYFMDGPHYFTAEKESTNRVKLTFYSYDKIVNEAIIEYQNLVQQISEVSKKLICYLHNENTKHDIVEELEGHLLNLNPYLCSDL